MSNCPLVFGGCTACSNTSTPKFSFAKQKNGNFLKSLQFSPDGAFTLAATEDNYALIGSLNPDTIEQHTYYTSSLNAEDPDYYDEKDHISSVPIGEAIYDLKWYPPHNQGAKCFVSTSRDHPIVLWDASSCEEDAIIRCTYRGYDPADELEAAISLCFNLAGDKLYAGANRTIRCFDVSRPGRECSAIATTPTKKSPYGQKGLISTIAFNPDYSGAFAAGSFSHSVGIYVENTPDCALLLGGLDFGVTCVKWSPCGRYLWVGGRNNGELQCWDIRATQSMVGTVQRKLTSNQRMTFDIDPWGKYLCTGDQDGQILFYDTTSFELVNTLDSMPQHPCTGSSGGPALEPDAAVMIRSCVNSVQFHPFSALLGVATGERSFVVDICAEDRDSDSEDDQTCKTFTDSTGATTSTPNAAVEGGHVEDIRDGKGEEASAAKRCKYDHAPQGSDDSMTTGDTTDVTLQHPSREVHSDVPKVSAGGGKKSVTAISHQCNSCIQIWQLPYIPLMLPEQEQTELQAEVQAGVSAEHHDIDMEVEVVSTSAAGQDE